VSNQLPNREQAIKLLQENDCPPEVIQHCLAVTQFAIGLAHRLKVKGTKIDVQLVEAGALLHDLGRSKTHKVDHSLVGSQIAQKIGLPQPIVNIIKRHVGAGITYEEAKLIGWPKDVYVPQTIEEKVVSYSDKRIDQNKVVPIETEIERLRKDGMIEAGERVRRLHEEITNLLGEKL
jgi:uncharacterized protein